MVLGRIKRYFHNTTAKAVVLMYHRICDIETDPWQLAVSPDNFESQIKTITKSFNVLPVSSLLMQLNKGILKHKAVYITFDDAYTDNFMFAKPILEKYACPATFFVPTYFIGKEQLFWWDELETILLHSLSLPKILILEVDEQVHTFEFEMEPLTNEVKEKQQAWHWSEEPPTNRCRLYLKIWELLKPLPINKILENLLLLGQWAGYNPKFSPAHYPMTTDQLTSLAVNPLFSLGIHTVSHPALGYHSKNVQSSEIALSKAYLEKNGLGPISTIAYPYGSYNEETIALVKENKIALGFTTSEEIITQDSLPLCLGRIQIPNCSGQLLKERLHNYFA